MVAEVARFRRAWQLEHWLLFGLWGLLPVTQAGGLGGVGVGHAGEPPRAPWQVISRGDGITVRRRPVPSSSLMEFQGTVQIAAPLSHVVAVLDDVNTRRQFSASTVETREVERSGLGKVVIYDHTSAPWPVAHRDMLYEVDFHFDAPERRVVVAFQDTKREAVPPRHGIVRVPLIRGHFAMRPSTDGRSTDVEYQVRFDPGGALPGWLVNTFSKQTPLRTLETLRRECKGPARPVEIEIESRADYQALMASCAPTDERQAPAVQVALPLAAPVEAGRTGPD